MVAEASPELVFVVLVGAICAFGMALYYALTLLAATLDPPKGGKEE